MANVSVEWAKATMIKEGALVWYYQDIQSGDYYYSVCEPESYEKERFYTKEVPFNEVPEWAWSGLAEDFAIHR